MRNKVLSIFHTVIPYVKELRAMAGSMEGCILMQQLDYWFALKPDGFYKFLEPVQPKGKDEQGNPIPGHRLYSSGDSWCEELNCTAHEFRRMFDAIGVRWNSKSEFTNAADPFCGRGYCSYVDRKQNLTYYFRNHALVDAFLDRFVADGAQNVSSSEKRSTDLGGLNPQSPKKPASIEQRLRAEITPTTTTTGDDGSSSHDDYHWPPIICEVADRQTILEVFKTIPKSTEEKQFALDELRAASTKREIQLPVEWLRAALNRGVQRTTAGRKFAAARNVTPQVNQPVEARKEVNREDVNKKLAAMRAVLQGGA